MFYLAVIFLLQPNVIKRLSIEMKPKLRSFTTLLSIVLLTSSLSTVTAKPFKMTLGGGEGTAQYSLASKFIEEFEKNTKNTVRLFPNSQLGSEQNTVIEASMGTLDFSVVAINNITPFSPTVGVYTLPYMITSLEEAEKLIQSDATDVIVANTVRDAGVRIISWTFSGFRVLTNSKKPIKTLDDLDGLVVRVPKNKIMIDTYKAWGINPTPMAWSELFTALQQKVVDGQDLPLVDIASLKFYEIQKYISLIHYNFMLEPMIVSEEVFQKQSKSVQAAIIEAGKVATAHSAKLLKEQEAEALKKLKAHGMEINEVDEAQWIKKASTQVWPKYYESVGGKDKINIVLKSIGREEI